MRPNVVRFTTLFIVMLIGAACSVGPTPTPTIEPTLDPSSIPEPTEPTVVLGPTGCPLTQGDSATEAATVTLGPINGAPPSTAKGETLIIAGTVYGSDCAPLANARLELWQTDAVGEYGPGHGGGEMQCCYYGGTVRTDVDGHFRIVTVKPGHYAGQAAPPPAHVHVSVDHPDAEHLETEFTFAGDPYLSSYPEGSVVVLELTEQTGSIGKYWFGIGDLVMTRRVKPSSEGSGNATGGVRAFKIMPELSQASYTIHETFADFPSLVTAIGITKLVEGELQVNLDGTPTLESLYVKVDLRELKTDEPDRDEKLANEWLVTDDFPYAYFNGTTVGSVPQSYTEGEAVTFTLNGEMTIRDVTRPLTFEVTATLADGTITGSTETTIKMTDFGIDPPNMFDFVKVEDEMVLTIKLTAEEQ